MVKKLMSFLIVGLLLVGMVGCSNSSLQVGNNKTNSDGDAQAKSDNTTTTNYPEKEIRVIIPFSAGGTSDLIARKIAQIIQEKNYLPKPMVVVNLPGTATQKGLNEVLKAQPDGYTLLVHNSAFNTMEAMGKLPMSYKDFTTIAGVLDVPIMLVAPHKRDYQNFSDYVDYAKSHPKKIKAGIPGVGTVAHFGLEYLLSEANSLNDFNSVPFKGGAEALTAQLGGQVELRTSTTIDAARYIDDGTLDPLVVMNQEGLEKYPNAKSLKDLDMSGEVVLRSGYFAPPNTPDDVVKVLQSAIKKATDTDEFKTFAKQQVAQVKYTPGNEWIKVLDSDQARYNKLAKNMN